MKKYGFGVDIGGTTCKIGLFLTEGSLVEKWEIPTNTENGGDRILDDVAKSLNDKIKEKDIIVEDVQGIGIGVPGPVLENGVVYHCVNLGWKNVPVAKILSEKTGINVLVENDANIAAFGEMWQGGGKGYNNVVMITLGTGVGGGIIENGKIISGVNGAAGEIGHLKVRLDEKDSCNCGRKGCLEQYASATGIVRMAKQRLELEHEKSLLDECGEVTAKDIFDSAKSGDKLGLELVESLGEILGNALGNIACIVDPQVFVIGGGVSKAGQILIDVIEKHYKNAVFDACMDTKISLASLGNDAGIYGGVKMVI